jgi:alkylation response protein AidB-like acyl-CoA dehydrogenase
MEPYSWWNKDQKQLIGDAQIFAEKNLGKGQEVAWTKKFPSGLLREVAKKGWFGAAIPKEYGGLELGVTGTAIVAEELSRICSALAEAYSVSMFGGVEQLLMFGTDEQRRKWLPRIAIGDVVGAVCITEPFVGSDASGIESAAERKGDSYILNGKKRFITNVGLADVYVVYAKTSTSKEDKYHYKHLTAFLVEKGTSGFSVEKVNELSGWDGLPNGFLDFHDVKIPASSIIGREGEGWKVMMAGLNFERTIYSAGMLGPMRESIRYAISYAQRRVQFGKPTLEIPTNQSKIADMIAGLSTSRLLVYHAARLLDEHKDAMIEAATAKLSTSETYERLISDAITVMGGDGWTRFYPVEGYLRDAKVNQIGAGTNDIMKLVILRGAMKTYGKDFKMPQRTMEKNLKIPTSTSEPLPKLEMSRASLLRILAEDYIVNPGLYLTREDLMARMTTTSEEGLDRELLGLETETLVKLHRDGQGMITLAKATYKGLREAGSLDQYKWFPDWLGKEYTF